MLSQFAGYVENLAQVPQKPIFPIVKDKATILGSNQIVPLEVCIVRNKNCVTIDFILKIDDTNKYVIELTPDMAQTLITFLMD